MQKLWHKNWDLNEVVEAFETHHDLVLDQKLVKFDVLGSLAHAHGLHKIGILSESETQTLVHGLQEINVLSQSNQFELNSGDEDVHTKIENYLTDVYGEVGKKIHTGRSRNDQVLTAIRLYTKQNLLQVWSEALKVITVFHDVAHTYSQTLIPGYTHLQKAMPSTVGLWAGAFAAGFLDDLALLKAAYHLNNQSPLGSAAGYGVPLALDRQFVADTLGFESVQVNPLYCQNSRGKIEAAVVAALISLLQGINKFATDVLLFTTSEFEFMQVDHQLCSGSSIMPQKKNVDIAELLRSKVHLLLGNYTQLVSLSSNLASGYNRDLQDSKKPLMESLDLTIQCLQITQLLAAAITINAPKVQTAVTPELFATQYALSLVKQGLPFRAAYQQAAANYQQIDMSQFSAQASEYLEKIGHAGLARSMQHYKAELNAYQTENQKFQTIVTDLLDQKGFNEKQN